MRAAPLGPRGALAIAVGSVRATRHSLGEHDSSSPHHSTRDVFDYGVDDRDWNLDDENCTVDGIDDAGHLGAEARHHSADHPEQSAEHGEDERGDREDAAQKVAEGAHIVEGRRRRDGLESSERPKNPTNCRGNRDASMLREVAVFDER